MSHSSRWCNTGTRVSSVCIALALVLIFVTPYSSLFAQELQEIYWTSARGIFKAPASDLIPEVVVPVELSRPAGIEIDSVSGKLYWTDAGLKKIRRSNLDGTDVEDLITEGTSNLGGMALDVGQNKMYWTDVAEHGIFRANLDGSDIETLIQVDSLYPVDITLDLEEGTFYWISDHSGYVFKSNLDGTGTELLNTTSQEALASIVVDPVNEKLYWSDWGRDRIQRANLDGSSIETIAFINLSRPWDLSLDLIENKIYWTELGKHAIYRANLDGSESELVTELGDPSRLAIDPKEKKVYWFDSENYKLVRANLNGGVRETLLETPAVFPHALAIDSRNESMYWNDIFYANLLTASMDGGDVQEISITGNSSFLGQSLRSSSSLLIDESQDKILWIGPGFPSGVVQANLDGTMAEQLVAVHDDFALQSIALDPPRNQIYWIDRAIKSYNPITYGYWFNRANMDMESQNLFLYQTRSLVGQGLWYIRNSKKCIGQIQRKIKSSGQIWTIAKLRILLSSLNPRGILL